MDPNRTLDDALAFYHTVNLCRTEYVALVKRESGHYSDKWSKVTGMDGKKSKGEPGDVVKEFLEKQMPPALFEVCFLDVVSTFERIVYEWIDNASGKMKDILLNPKFEKALAKDGCPFQPYAAGFIKKRWVDIQNPGDLRNLRDVKDILKDGGLDDELLARLEAIVNYRNWLAHGKRFSVIPDPPGDIPGVVEVLEEILTEIKG